MSYKQLDLNKTAGLIKPSLALRNYLCIVKVCISLDHKNSKERIYRFSSGKRIRDRYRLTDHLTRMEYHRLSKAIYFYEGCGRRCMNKSRRR
jgi:hypothetical protein